MCVIGFVFCYYKVPETKGISLENIEANIRRGLRLREIGQPLIATQPNAVKPAVATDTISG